MTDIMEADSAAAETVSKPQSSWRDHLKVHPAADLFPMMSEPELHKLGEDIKKNKQRVQIIFWIPAGRNRLDPGPPKGRAELIDGRNRLDAMEMVGLPIFKDGIPTFNWRYMEGDPYDLALSLNINRRHLTGEQKRELIEKVLKAKPEASNRTVAKQVKADHKTVAAVRGDLESVGEIPQLEKTVGADGKQYKSRPKKKAPEPVEQRATGSAEISADERREYYEATENPTTVDGQAVEILPPAPINPILSAWKAATEKQRCEFAFLHQGDIGRARREYRRLLKAGQL
jgi:hypothetical protein